MSEYFIDQKGRVVQLVPDMEGACDKCIYQEGRGRGCDLRLSGPVKENCEWDTIFVEVEHE